MRPFVALGRLQEDNRKPRRDSARFHRRMLTPRCLCLVSVCRLSPYSQGCLLLGRNIYVGSLADAIGRRASILAGCVVFLLGGTIQASAQNVHYMYGGRFLAGMGIGMLAMLAPLYQAEIAHPSIRGRLTTLQQFMLGIGALVASFIGYGCYHGLSGPAQWRIPLGASERDIPC